MGLDNGITIIVPKQFIAKLGTWDSSNSTDESSEYDICYWRKCWGIRRAILNVLDPEGLKRQDGETNYPIEAEDVPAIIRALRPFFNENYWNEEAESIWTFDEMFETLIDNVVNLQKLKELLESNPEVKCEFYDSY